MADDQASTSGGIPGLTQDFMTQLRRVIERLEGLTTIGESLPPVPGLPSVPSLSSLPGVRSLPRPGGLSAAQLKSVASAVAAQRRSIEALKAQLTAFDEQLVVLERILGPLAEWSRTWADLEDRLMNVHLGSGGAGGTEGTGSSKGDRGAKGSGGK
jgi:hypothetical protein